MAIAIPIEATAYGISFPNAYYRITGLTLRRSEGVHVVQIALTGYAVKPTSEAARSVDARVFDASLAEVDAMPGADTLTKCYHWLAANTYLSAGTPV